MPVLPGSANTYQSLFDRDGNVWVTTNGGVDRFRAPAVVRHRNREAAESHRQMGFFDGWGTVVTQLEAYAKGLMR